MHEIRKSHKAEIDLEDIWLYSFQQWGIEQAHRYHDELVEGMESLRLQPEIGKHTRHSGIDYRYIQVAKHVIFYRLQGNTIRIIRVLHERMDAPQHIQ